MKYGHRLLVGLLFFCFLGMWGCTQQKTSFITTKIHELETRYSKLEEDYRALQTTLEQNRKRLSLAESQRAALEKDKADLARQAELDANERDELRKQVAHRTTERDAAQSHLLQFSRDLQALAGRVESALNEAPHNPTVTILPASRRTTP